MEISSLNETTEDLKVCSSIHYIIILVLVFSLKNHETLQNKKRRVKLSLRTGWYFHHLIRGRWGQGSFLLKLTGCKIGKERILKKNNF